MQRMDNLKTYCEYSGMNNKVKNIGQFFSFGGACSIDSITSK